VLRALAIVFALIAAGCMIVAIAGMATGRQSARTGWLVRVAALVCFGAAVGLNIAAH
jgi:predicted membrane protein